MRTTYSDGGACQSGPTEWLGPLRFQHAFAGVSRGADAIRILLALSLAACSGGTSTGGDGDADADLGADADGRSDADLRDADERPDAETLADASSDASPDGDMAEDGGTTPEGPIGWASVSGLGVETTTGGGDAEPVVVTTLEALRTAVEGEVPAVVWISGSLEGTVRVGSNKTIEGAPGAELRGSLQLSGSVNVIIRNLTIVGYDCSDAPCGDGLDTVALRNGAHHVWIDHCDISDGSDGNLDITLQSDFVTVSWTRFSYSSVRAGGHQFSNLVGASDGATDDTGRLNVTWHHNWWAERVNSRMPRVRYGRNHLFNNLYTSEGNGYCVGLGVYGNILLENNVFRRVDDPIDTTSYSNAESVAVSRGNLYIETTGATADRGTDVFTPPYEYGLDETDAVEAAVRSGVGPR